MRLLLRFFRSLAEGLISVQEFGNARRNGIRFRRLLSENNPGSIKAGAAFAVAYKFTAKPFVFRTYPSFPFPASVPGPELLPAAAFA